MSFQIRLIWFQSLSLCQSHKVNQLVCPSNCKFLDISFLLFILSEITWIFSSSEYEDSEMKSLTMKSLTMFSPPPLDRSFFLRIPSLISLHSYQQKNLNKFENSHLEHHAFLCNPDLPKSVVCTFTVSANWASRSSNTHDSFTPCLRSNYCLVPFGSPWYIICLLSWLSKLLISHR